MSEAERIAAKLTEAQRTWFMSCIVTTGDRAFCRVAHFALPDGTVRYQSAEQDALTPLGLEVRKILEAQS